MGLTENIFLAVSSFREKSGIGAILAPFLDLLLFDFFDLERVFFFLPLLGEPFLCLLLDFDLLLPFLFLDLDLLFLPRDFDLGFFLPLDLGLSKVSSS